MLRLIANEYRSIVEKIEKEQAHEKLFDLNYFKDEYSYFAELLVNNSFLMFYSFAEEWIFLKVSNTEFKRLISNRGSITRFKNPLKKMGVDISKKDWSTLVNAEYLRDCLSHANGRVDLACLKNEKLENIINSNKRNSFIQIKNNRLYITNIYLNNFKEAIRNILHHP